MARPELPAFDLVVATVGRVDEIRRLFDSLATQTHQRFRVLLVDQNEDERLEHVVAEPPGFEVVRLRSEPGLSRARNRALGELTSDVVTFPDDDCVYPPDLLERVAGRFVEEAGLDGLTGRAVGPDGSSTASWRLDAAPISETNLWNRAVSYTIFLRREVVERVGSFDEQLGLGSGTRWSSGEEIDFLVRALRAGARLRYDPSVTVIHETKPLLRSELRDLGYRDGASVGYILRKHRYPAREVARRLLRPVGGILLSLVRLDLTRARFHAATLRGRLAGLRAVPAE